MSAIIETVRSEKASLLGLPVADPSFESGRESKGETEEAPCLHCGTLLRSKMILSEGNSFCCSGCKTVFALLESSGLTQFYQFGQTAGVRIRDISSADRFRYMDDPTVRQKLVDFSDGRRTSITFRIPSIHCIACVWLLENLFQLNPGIGKSQVNFLRKEFSVTFEDAKLKLGDLADLLARLGYEPELRLCDLKEAPVLQESKRLWLQLGVAGFVFGNLMLLSVSSYFRLDGFSGPGLNRLFGYIGLLLSVPVLAYSALDYWKSAWLGIRGRYLNIEVPIALGIIALTVESFRQVIIGLGMGYFDSLAGLIFFLLSGKMFQQKTFHRLSFDLDYRSFFPLSVSRKIGANVERISLSKLSEGDVLLILNGELIPADAELIHGKATIDYSFVTGESEAVVKTAGDYLYAGGRLIGNSVEIKLTKAVSQSYLTSLWNQAAFRKHQKRGIETMTNQYSKRFTKLVIGVALAASIYWSFVEPARAPIAFISVLIVACPCALALAAPFSLGTAQRVLGGKGVFLKSAGVVESLAAIDTIVFDKTGTLTSSTSGELKFHGMPLDAEETKWIQSLAAQSTHPYAVRISSSTTARDPSNLAVNSFREITGCGIEGIIEGNEIRIGSTAWLKSLGISMTSGPANSGSTVNIAINGKNRGFYQLQSSMRPNAERLLAGLSQKYDLCLLSGDNDRDRPLFQKLLGPEARLHFNQKPMDKLEFIERVQAGGKNVMMVGDGLNDAGALKQSNLGAAVVESVGSFSPASDLIIAASMVPHLDEVIHFATRTITIVRLSFLISALYNLVGISIAARGALSPVVCAILMPASSVSVVLFACLSTHLAARKTFGTKSESNHSDTNLNP